MIFDWKSWRDLAVGTMTVIFELTQLLIFYIYICINIYVYFFLSYKKRITSIEDKKERKDETLSAMFPEKIFLFFTCVPFFFHF